MSVAVIHSPAKLANPRIALVTTTLQVGGAERALVNLAIGLKQRGYEPVVYSLDAPPPPERAALITRATQEAIPVQFLQARSAWQLIGARRRLAKFLREQSPFCVQAFLFHANTVAALAARDANVPRLFTGIRVADPRRARHWLERRLASRVEKIVCVSTAVASFSKQLARLPAEKLVVIPNGVDWKLFAQTQPADLSSLGIATDRQLVVSIGRLDVQKGLDRLLPQMPRFFERCPLYDWLVVGDGPQKAELRTMVEELGLTARVHFIGWRADVPALLARSAALALPSRWEGMPNVLLEAMAARLPVIATRVEGVEEILGRLANPQAVAPDDMSGFVEQLIAIVVENGLAKSLGEKNQSRVQAEFSLEKMVDSYARLYESPV